MQKIRKREKEGKKTKNANNEKVRKTEKRMQMS